METSYAMLGVIIGLMAIAPIMALINMQQGTRKGQLFAFLWFVYLVAAATVLCWKGHLFVLHYIVDLADAFAQALMDEIDRAVREGPI